MDFQDPALPLAARVDDLIARLTLDEKISQMRNTCPAIPRLDIPAYDYWSEALHGVARNGRATVFPQAIGMAATWDPDLIQRVASRDRRRGPRQVSRGAAPQGRHDHLPGSDLLVAQRQHLSRSALGPRPGDLGRRPLPDRRDGRGLRARPAGRRPERI